MSTPVARREDEREQTAELRIEPETELKTPEVPEELKQVAKHAADDFYATLFAPFAEVTDEALPEWVRSLRRRALEHFETVGFPTTEEEDYKYTNVAPIVRGKFVPAVVRTTINDAAGEQLSRFIYEEAQGSRLVFVNGVFRADLSATDDLPRGLTAIDLAEALHGEQGERLQNFLARGAEVSGDDGFTALNTAFLKSGAYVHIDKSVEAEQPVHLLFLTDPSAGDVATFPRVLVIAEPFARATIIEEHKSLSDANETGAAYFSSPVVEFYVDDEAHVVHYKVQREAENAFHVARSRAEVGRASVYNSTTINLGAGFTRHNVNLSLRGEGSESWIDGLFFGQGEQFCDTHSLINHREPHCVSHQAYKGVLNDRSRSVFNGRIFVHQKAQKTDAYQSNKNLLLSDTARVDTKPQLEIFADDVKCSHGATVGQLNEDELFYLRSRGLGAEQARNLLTYGFAEAVIEKIEIESIKRQLNEVILNRLSTSFDV